MWRIKEFPACDTMEKSNLQWKIFEQNITNCQRAHPVTSQWIRYNKVLTEGGLTIQRINQNGPFDQDLVQRNQPDEPVFDNLMKNLKLNLFTKINRTTAMDQLRNMKQGDQETFKNFYERVTDQASICDINNEDVLIKIVIRDGSRHCKELQKYMEEEDRSMMKIIEYARVLDARKASQKDKSADKLSPTIDDTFQVNKVEARDNFQRDTYQRNWSRNGSGNNRQYRQDNRFPDQRRYNPYHDSFNRRPTTSRTQYNDHDNRNGPNNRELCMFCGNKRHQNLSECKARSETCQRCGKRGHLAHVCMAPAPTRINSIESQYTNEYNSTKHKVNSSPE